jgi:hypothetical protein
MAMMTEEPNPKRIVDLGGRKRRGIRLMKIAILTAVVLAMAGSVAMAGSAKRYAPGQLQKNPGDAKKYAPGQRQKEPGQAKTLAPGQQQKKETTGGRR